jgi:hypothetical protein
LFQNASSVEVMTRKRTGVSQRKKKKKKNEKEEEDDNSKFMHIRTVDM